MTCKDCLHYGICRLDVCFIHADNADTYQCQDSDKVEEDCEAFTDKSEWVHLPYKVGDTVYEVFMNHLPPFIQESVAEKIIITSKGLRIKLSRNSVYETSISALGKTLFLTKEEADKALEERKQ